MKKERLQKLAGVQLNESAENLLKKIYEDLKNLEENEAPDSGYFEVGNKWYKELSQRFS